MTQKEAFDLVVLRFIDAYVDLHNEIGTKEITQQFHMHRTRASATIKQYKEHKPSNLRFNVSTKRYEKGYTFEKVYLGETSSFNYLNSIETVFGLPDKN